jgi:endonuclease/exonuclease/phosphatase family metal-dependent hydrolase
MLTKYGPAVVRIASYNVENLFARPKVFRTADPSAGAPKLAAYEQVNALFKKDAYSAQDKADMKSRLIELDIYFVNAQGAVRRKETSSPRWAWLRKNRGGFDRQPEDETKDIEIIADGRDDWIGWVELAKEAVDETSTRMTAKVIDEGVDAEIIAVVEAEDRPSLLRFNDELLGKKYRHIMLVDGNDPRGIDVGIMSKSGFPVRTIRSNVDAEDAQGIVFSRDCPEYEVLTQNGTHVFVLVNHFKSQSGGGGAKRQRQAKEVRQIVDRLVGEGKHVVVLGDLNEGPRRREPRLPTSAPCLTTTARSLTSTRCPTSTSDRSPARLTHAGSGTGSTTSSSPRASSRPSRAVRSSARAHGAHESPGRRPGRPIRRSTTATSRRQTTRPCSLISTSDRGQAQSATRGRRRQSSGRRRRPRALPL